MLVGFQARSPSSVKTDDRRMAAAHAQPRARALAAAWTGEGD
jgi:hypothetical protein